MQKWRKKVNQEKILTSITEKYYDQIFGYCNIKLHSEQDAYDCTQEVFRLFLEKYQNGEITITEKTGHWLLATAKNIIRNHIKYSVRHPRISIDSSDITLTTENFICDPEDPFKDIIDPEEYKIIYEKYILEKDIKEMSRIHGVSEAAIYKRIERIVHKIRKNYSDINPEKK